MPVIRIDTKPLPTLSLEKRASLLATLKNELEQGTENGPVIFEIPLGKDCFDVLVIWDASDWRKLRPEERSDLIHEAYDEAKREQIAQASGVTHEEAIQQQLLPYAIASRLEEPLFGSLICEKDPQKMKELQSIICDAKRAYGGVVWPYGKMELRFPTREMAEIILAKLKNDKAFDGLEHYWSVVESPADLAW